MTATHSGGLCPHPPLKHPGWVSGWLAGFTASALLAAGLPAQAFPNARVNLIRITGDGVTALPGLSQASLPPSGPAAPASAQLLSQATPPAAGGPSQLAAATDPLVLNFAGELPQFGPDDYVSIRVRSGDSSNGTEIEQIRFDSPAVVISPDRRSISITPSRAVEAGQTLAALLPTGNYVLPLATSSCFFELAPPVAALPPVIPPAPPPPPPFPVVTILLGIAAAGLICCAIGGCFSGNGGTNDSSN
ncbi:MAG: hypothetical protein DCF23_02370 [Cyanobium sp.]|uniref:hypothetical protein n=1 Tax=Synechococcus sp. CS-1324 TaxID=2847980 RepID=UPI000DB6DCC8|nr:hypothetical protein [Synechococcus sp. CS-1324]PZV05704.1 MAG: hypothetical protein DCF23_02370 [Cyanobium sp.]